MSIEPKVSIIVPVHDTPKDYLEQCVSSVLGQKYQNWELILVNDHSDAVTECALLNLKTDNRISVIANNGRGGVSGTRNVGIEYATGTLIMFLDSDDWIEPETLFKTVPLMMGTDLVSWNHYYNEGKKQWKRHDINNSPVVYELYNMSDLLLDMITPEFDARYNNVYLGAVRGVWGKLYKKEYIDKFKVRFEENLKIGEDACFNVDYIRNINKASFYNFYLNHYRVDNGSANRRCRGDIAEIRINLLRAYLSRFPIGEDINANTCYVREVLSCVLNCVKKIELEGENIGFKDYIQNIFEHDEVGLVGSLTVDNGFYSVQEKIIKELITKKSVKTMTLLGLILRHESI